MNGTEPICLAIVNTKQPTIFPGAPQFARDDDKRYTIYSGPCSAINDLEGRKRSLLRAIASDSPKSATIAFKRLEESARIKRGGPTWAGYLEAAIRSVLALIAGLICLKIGNWLWVKVFGRLRDPIWIRA